MDIGRINEATVRDALERIRGGRPLSAQPLLELALLRRHLSQAGMPATPEGLAWILGETLAGLITEELATARGLPAAALRDTDGEGPEADFASGVVDREAWSALFHRYAAPRPMLVREIATAAGLGGSDPSRYVRRRMSRGYQLVASALRRLEIAEAEAEQRSSGAATATSQRSTAGATREDTSGVAAPSSRPAAHLPRAVDAFIGRTRELATLGRHLNDGPLVTLTGPGGSGKTRLALELARMWEAAGAVEAYFVDLTAVTQADQVLGCVASAVGAREQPEVPVLESLAKALDGVDTLIVLDNCEHIVASAAEVAGALLQRCPRLRLLATSRETLRVTGETVLPLAPLSTDGTAGEEPESVALFRLRARAVRPDLELNERDVAVVREICLALDGLPLAIELAAARARSLSPAQIADRMGDRLRLLGGGRRTAAGRHRTLQAAIDWSLELIGPDELALWRRLSVFRGGWTLEAAEAVCAGGPVEPTAVVDLLAGLVEKSLVVAPVKSEHAESPRFRLLETLHEAARDSLHEAGEATTYHVRHAQWCRIVATPSELERVGQQSRWLDRVAIEYDNLCAAMARGGRPVESPEGPQRATPPTFGVEAVAIGASLWRYWWIRGRLAEGRSWLSRVLSDTPLEAPPSVRMEAYRGAGVLAAIMGDEADARFAFEESLHLSREAKDSAAEAAALNDLGMVASGVSELDEAAERLEQALALRRTLGEPQAVAYTLHSLGGVYDSRGRSDEARSLIEESLDIARDLEDVNGIGTALVALGRLEVRRGRLDAATPALHEALAIWRAIDDPLGEAHTLSILANVARLQDRLDEAVLMQEDALARLAGLGSRRAEVRAMVRRALLMLAHGDVTRAQRTLREVLLRCTDRGSKGVCVAALGVLALAAVDAGEAATGLQMLAATSTIWQDMGVLPALDMRAAVTAAEARARAELDAKAADRAWLTGKDLDWDEARHWALETLGEPTPRD